MSTDSVKVSWKLVAGFLATALLSLSTWAASDAVVRLAKVEEKQHVQEVERTKLTVMHEQIMAAQERDHRLIVEIAKRNGILIPE